MAWDTQQVVQHNEQAVWVHHKQRRARLGKTVGRGRGHLRLELAGQTLGEGTQGKLGTGKAGKTSRTPQGSCCSCEQDGSLSCLQHAGQDLPPGLLSYFMPKRTPNLIAPHCLIMSL